MASKGIVWCVWTNGWGNNMFRYAYGRLLAERYRMRLITPELPALGIQGVELRKFPDKTLPVIYIEKPVEKDTNYFQRFFSVPDGAHCNFRVHCYPEDFRLYTPHTERIRGWFPAAPKTNTRDLVLHLRLGDRLLIAGCFRNGNAIAPEHFEAAINSFAFERLHIVTDMPAWEPLTERKLDSLTFHRPVAKDRAPLKDGVEYFNALYRSLIRFDPLVRAGNSVESDFAFMRSFDKIMFQHGTLAWWAAFLSDATDIAVLGRWRGGKDTNLGWTDLPNWRQWGPKSAPPRTVKEYHLLQMARRHGLNVFVETGTAGGTTIEHLQPEFRELYSIELGEAEYKYAKRKLSKHPNVMLLQGDSGERIKEVLPRLKEPALFWLDAHYQGEGKARGSTDTPVLAELDAILSNYAFPHVIIIDDLRKFDKDPAYPTLDEVKRFVSERRPELEVTTRFDSIRITQGGEAL